MDTGFGKDNLGAARSFLEIATHAARDYCGPTMGHHAFIMCSDHCLSACLAISDLADTCGSCSIPTFCDDRIPGWAGQGCCAILVSASGMSYDLAIVRDELRSRGCETLCIISGEESVVCDGNKVEIPGDLDSVGQEAFVLGTLCAVFASTSLDSITKLQSAVSSIELDLDKIHDRAESICRSIGGGIIAVYSTSETRACSKSWADFIGMRTGRFVFCSELPEFDHNELVGWSDPNSHAPGLRIVVLREEQDESIVSTIVVCMLEVLRENGRDVTVVDIGSGSSLQKDLTGMILGHAVAASMEVMQ